MTRGIGEIPFGTGMSAITRQMMVSNRAVSLKNQKAQAPPSPPSNLKVTAQPFGNLVQWTRSADADSQELLIGATPSTAAATIINVGNTCKYVDNIGQSGITHFYWVRSVKTSGQRSTEIGYVTGTSLASNMGVTPPIAPPPAQVQVFNSQLGRIDIRTEREVTK
jgi:hypothetical protein